MMLMTTTLRKIHAFLPKAFRKDRIEVEKQLNRLKEKRGDFISDDSIQKQWVKLEKQLHQSVEKKNRRKQNLPLLNYNKALPIFTKKDEIIDAITNHQVVIISGETGSGKTTQIPKFCLAAGRGIEGQIGCTQPRRIAATTVARRISEEFGEQLGKSVGFKIRFQDKTHSDVYIKIMTDGILLAETQGDPQLHLYDTLIVDEAHERSLNIDFILGLLKTLLKQRKDLKLIITSATIDTEKFSKAFDHAPVIEVTGRMFPVEVRYLSQESTDENDAEQTHMEMTVSAIDRLLRETARGDILIFMPTEQDIRDTCELIKGRKYKGIVVLPLYARLPEGEQSRVFVDTVSRKIIVATNIAETSITLPGIKYVIDTGLARISQYIPRSRTTSLSVKPISRSSADQRKGRCGRVENGICIRLYSEEDYNHRPLFTPPEVLRTNLAEVLLKMMALKIGDPTDFPFIDRPNQKSVSDGFDLLKELGAIDGISGKQESIEPGQYTLTSQGKLMARLPIDPRLSRMLIEAKETGCLNDLAVIVSALSVQDPWERSSEKTQEADEKHAMFKVPSSDFMTLLNVWKSYHMVWQQGETLSSMKRYCKIHYLSFKRMREWRDVYAQISAILREEGIRERFSRKSTEQKNSIDFSSNLFDQPYTRIHRSILSGLLSNIARKKNKNVFQAAKDREVMIFPGSALFNGAGNWIVAAEMIETSRVFARMVANIDPAWLEDLGKAHCKYTYHHPHWERNRDQVVASEQVTLFGLIIEPGRQVSYGRINPKEASELFIRSALVEGDIRRPFSFMKHNQMLMDTIRDMENKVRRRDMLVGDEEMFWFYQDRLDVCYDIGSLQNHLKQKGGDHHLRMKQEDLLKYSPDKDELALFPEKIILGNHTFDLNYRFDPGRPDDGVTIKIPLTEVPVIPRKAIDWLVPGLYREKIHILIKGLPKTYRKQLAPISQTVDIIIQEMEKTQDALITALGKFIYRRFHVDIPASAWPEDQLPDHLKALISIRDSKDQEIRSGRDPAIFLGTTSGTGIPPEVESFKQKWEKTGITCWNFGGIPEEILIKIPGNPHWVGYPGLEKSDENPKEVGLRLFQNRDDALNAHKKGVMVLFTNHFSKDLKFLKRHLTLSPGIADDTKWLGSAKQIEKRLYQHVIKDLFSRNIRSEKQFYACTENLASNLLAQGKDYLDKVVPVLDACSKTHNVLHDLRDTHRFNTAALQLLEELEGQLKQLVPESFMDLYDDERFSHLIRYLQAIEIRAQRAMIHMEKDREKAMEIRSFSDKLNELLADLPPILSGEKKTAIEEFFWMIEEYKISVFSQELKTAIPISRKRLEAKLGEIQRIG